MSEWQPIETAPKDGTRFLATIPGHEPVYCWYMGDRLLAWDWREIPRLPTLWVHVPKPPAS